MDKFVVKTYPKRFWQVAEVFKNGNSVAKINMFYEVTPEWIIIYDATGGSSDGQGWRKGEIQRKIYIGDSEFSKETGT